MSGTWLDPNDELRGATLNDHSSHRDLVPRREGDGLRLPWTGQHKEKQS